MRKIFAALLFAATATSFAQEGSEVNATKGPYETNRMKDNWFLQLGVGPSIYLGEMNEGGLGKRIAPVFDLGIGKWVTPSVGVRMQFSLAPSMKEYSTYGGKFNQWAPDPDGLRLHKFHNMNLHADVMWDVINAIGGYNERRLYSIIPFVGLGVGMNAYSGASSKDMELAANVGLLNKFRLSKSFDVNLELRSAISNGRFDDALFYNRFDVPVSATVGFTYRFGKVKTFKRVNQAMPVASADFTPYQDRIQALEKEKTDLNNKAQRMNEELNDLRNRQPQSSVADLAKPLVKASPVVLFFELGKTSLDSKELTNLEFYVRNAIKLDQEKVFTLIGSADKDTGTAEVNMRITEQRTQYVYDLLKNKYNIPTKRLVKKNMGDTDNRFAEPKLNRAVIIE